MSGLFRFTPHASRFSQDAGRFFGDDEWFDEKIFLALRARRLYLFWASAM
ncbi:hypothetical protein [Pelomicrobium methylotrophicum]|nr:hypothetical protein [Pelomicrobium methylotrophicum]